MHAQFLPLTDQAPRERLTVLHRPAGAPRSLMVYAHPWAEEMNKSRRMVAMQARALAAAGHAVLLVDLLGCGDSPCDYGDASWSRWVDDLVAAAHWLRQDAAASANPGTVTPPLTLWGLRAGALLAAAAAERLGDVHHLLLWQPAAAGRTLLQQFLRLQAVAQMLGRESAAAGSDALRTRLGAGYTVEVAGYRVAPALAQGLDQARLAPVRGLPRLTWLEVSLRDAATLSPAACTVLAEWNQAGCTVHSAVVAGPAFWQTVEIEDAPALLPATLTAQEVALAAAPGQAPAAAAAGSVHAHRSLST
jgi:exosortase A-associated hydrolase 2